MRLRLLYNPFIYIVLFSLFFLFETNIFAGTVITRNTGTINWSSVSTWLSFRTGQVQFTNGSTTVTGTGTQFTTELQIGDIIMLQTSPSTVRGTVFSITDNTTLVLTASATATASGDFGVQALPTSNDDVYLGNDLLIANLALTLDVASVTLKSLTVTQMAAYISLTHSGTNSLTVTGDVLVNQPLTSTTNTWSVSGGTATVQGVLTVGSGDATSSRVARVSVGGGTLNLDSTVVLASNTTNANEDIRVSTGTITFKKALTVSSGSLTYTSSGTMNFNAGLTFGGANAPLFTTTSGCNLNFGSDFTNNTLTLTLSNGSNTIFSGNATVTPTTPITFSNVQLNSGVTVALGGNISVSGNWTNNGGTLSGGSNTVTLTSTSGTISGSGSTVFPNLAIAAGANYTMNNNNSCSSFTLAQSSSASSFTHGSSAILTVNGNVTINQPSASVTTAWNINAGTGTVNGNLSLGGTNTSSLRIAKIAVTTGSLSVSGTASVASNATAATEQITLTTGTITLSNLLNLHSGTISVTSTGTINFNGGFSFGNSNNPSFSTVSGTNVNIGGDLSATGNALSFNSGSNQTFTASSVLTPNAAITFGNVQINAGDTLRLGGSISVAGSWTNNNGILSGGSHTVTFTGSSKTIGGTAGTDFPNVVFTTGASYTLNTSGTASSLTLNASSTASSLTHSSGISLNVSGNVTMNQPTANVTTSWNINAGSSTVSGTFTFVGTDATASRIMQVAVTSGSFSVNGLVTYASNTTAANQVISVSTGTLTFGSLVTLSSGTMTLSSTGTINFNGGLTFGGANNPSFSTVASSKYQFWRKFNCNINFAYVECDK